jgi:hypothetical protein
MHSSGVSFPGTAFFSLSKQAAGSIESAEAQMFFWSFCQASQAPKDSVTAGQAAGTVTAGILH